MGVHSRFIYGSEVRCPTNCVLEELYTLFVVVRRHCDLVVLITNIVMSSDKALLGSSEVLDLLSSKQ